MVDIDNSNGQTADAYKRGQYALANILYHPTPDVFLGPEIQWGKRENFRDGFDVGRRPDPVLGQVQLQDVIRR